MRYSTAVVIPAAGSGTRMGLSTPKQFALLADIPILLRTVCAFTEHPDITQIILVVPAAYQDKTHSVLHDFQLDDSRISIIQGGRRRQDSVLAGLQQVKPEVEVVLVHDAARPFVSRQIIDRCIQEAWQHGAAIAAIPVKDTLKRQNTAQQVEATIDRNLLWQAQTPQAARRNLLEEAFTSNLDADVTDESMLLERAGIPIQLVEGSEENFKITRPEDLVLAEKLLSSNQTQLKIGHGFDAHRLVEGRKLVLGGVTIPFHLGLDGHSDADVLTHALCDALLGAAGEGDIGRHFPDSSASYADIYSIHLLARVIELLKKKHLRLHNADITLICQAPKLAPYTAEMKSIIATTCEIAGSAINIKATTTEKMGYTGRGEGISCHAVVLLHTLPPTLS